MTFTAPVFLDFEASGLRDGSYPIEVGICSGTYPIKPASKLISPHHSWKESLWDAEAESVHGISRKQCLEEGEGVVEVASWLNSVLEGHVVYVDTTSHDEEWALSLFRAAGLGRSFRIEWMMPLFDRVLEARDISADQRWAYYEFVARQARVRYPHRHRAGPDAAGLAGLYDMITGDQAISLETQFRENWNEW